jgi:mRNA guanylyltransferase
MMFREILPRLAHGNDGLIFTSLAAEYICGTDPHMLLPLALHPLTSSLKWKPDDENSIDFLLNLVFPPNTTLSPYTITTSTPFDQIPAGTTFQLSIWTGGKSRGSGQENHIPWGDMYVPAADWEKIQSHAPQGQEIPLEGAIIECRWDKKVGAAGRWRFMRFRRDKENANFIEVAKNVQESIKDGVSKEELVSWAVDIKAGWRQRHPKK